MRVRVIKPYVSYLGKKGTEREIPDAEARVHIDLGNAERCEPPPPRRTYHRRDMTAESPTATTRKRKKRARKASQ